MENIKQYYMYVHSYKMDAILKDCKRPKVVSLKIINGNCGKQKNKRAPEI